MAKLSALDSQDFPLSQELSQLEALAEKICAQIRVDHKKGLCALRECLCQGYVLLFPVLRKLAQDEKEGVRRALVQAVGEAADPADPFRASFLLEILSPLLFDPVPRIRLAARRVLRERLLAVYPGETVEVLVQWAAEPDPARRILAAQLLGHAPPKLARQALIALKHLARTGEGKIRPALLAALRRLARKNPQIVGPELLRWQADPALASFVQKALNGQKLPQS